MTKKITKKTLLIGCLLLSCFVGVKTFAQTAIPTFHCMGLYWSPTGGTENKSVLVKYRVLGTTQWYQGLAMRYNPIAGTTKDLTDYRGSVVNLTPNTNYEFSLQLEGTSQQTTLTASTYSENFPIASTVNVGNQSSTYTITNGGTASGYVVYDGGGSTIDCNLNSQDGMVIDADYVIIRNFIIKNTKANGIEIAGRRHHIVIENCDISKWGSRDNGSYKDANGVSHLNQTSDKNFGEPDQAAIYNYESWSGPGAYNFVIQRNKVHHPNYDTNSWDEIHGDPSTSDNGKHPNGPTTFYLQQSGGNNVIRYNEIWSDADHYFNDAIGARINQDLNGYPGPDTDIYGNYIANCFDDGIELEGGGRNVRVWNNYIENTYEGIANAPVRIGPLYMWKNVIGKSTLYGVKMGTAGSVSLMTGQQYFFNNTFLQPNNTGSGGLGTSGSNARDIKHFMSRNNILHTRTGRTWVISNKSSNEDNTFDYDLTSAGYPAGHEVNGVNGIPTYTSQFGFDFDSKTGNFILDASSKGYDKGLPIPNFADSFEGTAPDIGAQEGGTSAIVYGVNANFIPPIPTALITLSPSFSFNNTANKNKVETFGNPPGSTGTSTIPIYTLYDNYGNWEFTGTTQIAESVNSVSNNSLVGIPSASGYGNVFFRAGAGEYFEISKVNTLDSINPTVKYLFYKSTDESTGDEMDFSYSTDGTNYTAITIPDQPSGVGTKQWRPIILTGLPKAANLRLRWKKDSATTQIYRIDDIKIYSVKNNQTITFNPITDKVVGDTDFEPEAHSDSGLAIEYISSDENIAFVDDGRIYILAPGTVTITAKQIGDEEFNSAEEVNRTFKIRSSQTVDFAAIDPKYIGDADFILSATASSSLPVTFNSSNPSVAVIANDTVKIIGIGTAFITAKQEGNDFYAYADSIQTLIVSNIAIKAQHQNGDNSVSNNQIKPNLKLVNESPLSVPYKELTARYWITAENYNMINTYVDWAQIGNNVVKLKYVELEKPRVNALGYIEYSFDHPTLTLSPNANSGPIQTRIANADWTDFNELNDYSYATNINYTDNQLITLYRNGSLIWGNEPDTVAAETKVKVMFANKNNKTNSNSLSANLILVNDGNQAIAYDDLTLRYWFTNDGSNALNYDIDYAKLGASKLEGSFVSMGAPLNNADTYFQLKAKPSQLGKLYPFSNTGDIQYRISKSNWSNFNELNDHSYKAKAALAENMNVTVYYQGQLIYGIEPNSSSNIVANTISNKLLNADDLNSKLGGNWAIYPNPANNFINLSIHETPAQNAAVKVYNLEGKLLRTHQLIYPVTTINIETLPKGIYLLNCINGKSIENKKFIKE